MIFVVDCGTKGLLSDGGTMSACSGTLDLTFRFTYRNELCGLLQCKGGASAPVNSALDFTATQVGSKGNVHLICK